MRGTDFGDPGGVHVESLKDDVYPLLRAFVELAPSLDRVELVRALLHSGREALWRENYQFLRDLLIESKPMTPEVAAEVACSVTPGLDILDRLERLARDLPAPGKQSLLTKLIQNMDLRGRDRLSQAEWSRFRKLCDVLVESANEFSPEGLSGAACKVLCTYKPDDDAGKTWALSLVDKLWRAMRTLPMSWDAPGGVSTQIAENLSVGHFRSVEHQSAVLEILDRLVDESHPIGMFDKGWTIDSLEKATKKGIVANELRPRFEAIISRLESMNAFDDRLMVEI
ncbi:MAG: hypothetical protein JF606_28710 [Burkholderiales bacterium]|nr:hypothetical protein [Burkholderiales bacterium]